MALAAIVVMVSTIACSSAIAAGEGSQEIITSFKYTDRPSEPTWFTPTPSAGCETIQEMRYVDEIQWSSWGGATATGTAIAGRGCGKYRGSDGMEIPIGPVEGSPVTVTLSNPKECAGWVSG